MNRIVYILIGFLTAHSAFSQIDEANIRRHIRVLSSDSIMGRGTGTEGEKMAAEYIAGEFSKIGLLPKGDGKTFFQSFPFKGGVHAMGPDGTARNIAGFIDNHAPSTIIIGAHYDHLGLGLEKGSLEANSQNKIHNGADDNASGTAGVIELARYFKNNKIKEKYNYLFLCFSGEELGLLGSKYFSEHPTIEISKADCMINMDMIGRLDPATHKLIVNGTGTSALWENLLKDISTPELSVKTDSSGLGPSDHSSFYLKSIPVLHFFTGSHADYHKPSDDYTTINASGEVEVLNLIIRLIQRIDAEPKLVFLTTKNKSMTTQSEFKVTLGVMPNYAGDVNGLKIDGVIDGRPASKAGIKSGDIVIQIGTLPITNIETYMGALGKFEKGQVVPVKVLRENKELMFEVTF